MWSTEDHTIIKKDIQWIDTSKRPSCQISKVFLTTCGNFGMIGYENGVIVKVNMQSGMFRETFQHKGKLPSKIFANEDEQ